MTIRLRLLVGILVMLLGIGVWRWRSAPRTGPGSTSYNQAVDAARQGDSAGAIASLRQAVILEPANGDYHAELGNAYLQQRDYDRALSELEAAAFLAPDHPHVYCQLAQALVDDRRRDDALAALQEALRRAPNCPHALSVRGEQYLRDDNLKASLADFERVIRLDPSFALAYSKAAYILERSNRLAEAEEYLARGLRASPRDAGMHVMLGEIILRQRRDPASLDAVEQHLRLALPENPAEAKVHADLGRVALLKGDQAGARAEFQKALAAAPLLSDALYGMSQVEQQAKHGAEATRYRERYQHSLQAQRELAELSARADAQPANVDLRLRLARTFLDRGLLKDAGRTLNTAIQAAPDDPRVRELRAQLFLMLNEEERAQREFTVASRLTPEGR